jgi:16S rRNA A1518/A1519 N6-dimethyltransferase RsmA/KsgA/DIM1 with predicted DNA glycosylase/AP lyase activity
MFENLSGWELYSKIIQQKCFDCIDENSKVLEIGPGHGSFTKLILDKNPKFLELVEPNDLCYNNIKIKFGNCSNVNIKKQDIFETLSTYQKKEFDVQKKYSVKQVLEDKIEALFLASRTTIYEPMKKEIAKNIIFTGRIDEYYYHSLGKLQYRSSFIYIINYVFTCLNVCSMMYH